MDSSKVGIRLKYLLRNPALDVRVIRLVRDGRGVALAHVDPARFADAADPAFRGGGTGGGREDEMLDIRGAATEWRRSNEEAEAALSALDPARWTSVRYEELCADPGRTLRRLFAFIGVDPGVDPCVGTERPGSAALHVIGNGMRMDASRRIAHDGRWRQELSRVDLRAFESVAGPLNRRLGYL